MCKPREIIDWRTEACCMRRGGKNRGQSFEEFRRDYWPKESMVISAGRKGGRLKKR